jgi:serine/threonine protein kinase
LEQIVERYGAVSPERTIHCLAQLCGALREAHATGLIHRDIKPSNVIICERGGEKDVAKLLDFGLVAAVGTTLTDPKITQAGAVAGTPAFMSPEQCASDEPVGPASDIYSLGALGYYLLIGQVVFAGRSPMQMLAAHLYETPMPMSGRGVTVPSQLEAVIVRCLAKDPAEDSPAWQRCGRCYS